MLPRERVKGQVAAPPPISCVRRVSRATTASGVDKQSRTGEGCSLFTHRRMAGWGTHSFSLRNLKLCSDRI